MFHSGSRLAHALADALLGDDQVPAAQDRLAMRNQRMASLPSRSKTSVTSG